LLAGPAVAAYGVFSNAETNSTGRIAVTFVLSLLVFTRLASLLAGERRLREELVRRNERLLELDRMKDDFVAAVSHELRTPLTSTLGFLRTLEARDSELGEAERRRFVTIARREGERLELLVQDLLSVAEDNALRLDRSEVDLSRLARARVQCARETAEKKQIDLTFVAEEAPAIRADGARLAQVLDNLLSNALKFTPPCGRVDVRVSSAPGRAVLEVEDTGIGIPAREREHVFERFFRASTTAVRAIPGTGLGLAIVKAIVDAHGGTVAVTSTEATGSLFRIEFPLLVRGREAGERESLARAEH
jgi:signal transduction histidine kinase